jgi:hypothetical protein
MNNEDNNDINWDKNSEYSEVSINTDIKVFNGAINGKNYLSQLNPNNNINQNKILFKNTPLNKENNINNKSNLNNDNKKEKIISKNINNDLRNLQVKSFNLFNNETQKENVNKQYEEETNSELLSFRNEIDTSNNKKNIKMDLNQNLNKELKNQQLLMKFKDLTLEDEELINSVSVQILEKPLKRKKIDSYQTMTNSQCTFRVSSIENGIALLVNSQNYIFTLPTILLPKSVKIGNEYNFFIEETNKNILLKSKVSQLQKNYQNIIGSNN